jgi:chromosome segregation ATPase
MQGEAIGQEAPAAQDASTNVSELVRLRAELEAEKTGHENLLHQLEQNYVNVQQENSDLRKDSTDMSQRAKDKGEKYEKMREDHDKAVSGAREKERTIDEQASKIASLETKVRNLAELVESQQRDIDATKGSTDKSSEKALAVSATLSEAQDRLGELETAQVRLKFDHDKLARENTMFEKNHKWHEEELAAKNEALVKLRSEKSEQVGGLESRISELNENESVMKARFDSASESLTKKNEQIEAHLKTIRDLETTHSFELEQLQLELDKQMKLSKLYKESTAQEREKAGLVIESMERLQAALALEQDHRKDEGTTSKEAITKLANELKALDESFEEASRTNEKLVGELQSEREKTQPLMFTVSDDDSVSSGPMSLSEEGRKGNQTEQQLKFMSTAEELRKTKREYRELELYATRPFLP